MHTYIILFRFCKFQPFLNKNKKKIGTRAALASAAHVGGQEAQTPVAKPARQAAHLRSCGQRPRPAAAHVAKAQRVGHAHGTVA